jgi:site-specific recombinase XerD
MEFFMHYSSPKQQLMKLFAHIEGAYAPNTLRAYKADAAEFCTYCERHRKRVLPADPETIADFLMSASETGLKAATIRRKVASISAIHRLSNLTDPTKHSEVKLALRKIHRKIGTKCRQAYPITESVLQKLLTVCGEDIRGKRNKALLMLAYDSMRRRAEIVSLQAEDIDRDAAGRISILLRKSKTDQDSTGQWIHLGHKATLAIDEWLGIAGIKSNHILRGLNASGVATKQLSAGQVGRLFKSLAKKAGLTSEAIRSISGHSMRVGGAQDLLLKGATLPQIMVKGGWVKTDTVLRYVERVRQDPCGVSN